MGRLPGGAGASRASPPHRPALLRVWRNGVASPRCPCGVPKLASCLQIVDFLGAHRVFAPHSLAVVRNRSARGHGYTPNKGSNPEAARRAPDLLTLRPLEQEGVWSPAPSLAAPRRTRKKFVKSRVVSAVARHVNKAGGSRSPASRPLASPPVVHPDGPCVRLLPNFSSTALDSLRRLGPGEEQRRPRRATLEHLPASAGTRTSSSPEGS